MFRIESESEKRGVQTVLALALFCFSGCATDPGESKPGTVTSPVTPDEPATTTANTDLVPKYLSPDAPLSNRPALLTLKEELHLKVPPDLPPIKAVPALSVTSHALYLLDFPTATVWQFSRGGEFLRRFGQSYDPALSIQRGIDLVFSERRRELYVANAANGLLVFNDQGQPVRRVSYPPFAYSLVELPNGNFAVCMSRIDGPHWTLLKEEAAHFNFYSRRRPRLPPGEEFLTIFVPHSYGDADSDGNLYIGQRALPGIRKFTKDGHYIGDFIMQDDPHLTPVPERLTDEQRERLFAGIEPPDFTRLMRLSVVSDRYLVVQLNVPEGETRLHFYTLEGEPAFAQMNWKEDLIGRDDDGLLYFSRIRPGPPSLAVYSLGEVD